MARLLVDSLTGSPPPRLGEALLEDLFDGGDGAGARTAAARRRRCWATAGVGAGAIEGATRSMRIHYYPWPSMRSPGVARGA